MQPFAGLHLHILNDRAVLCRPLHLHTSTLAHSTDPTLSSRDSAEALQLVYYGQHSGIPLTLYFILLISPHFWFPTGRTAAASGTMDHHSDSHTSIGDGAELDSRSVRPTIKTSPRKRQSKNTPAAYPRKRAIQACRTCRLRRTKCDNEHPSCTSCVGMGIECIYQEKDSSK